MGTKDAVEAAPEESPCKVRAQGGIARAEQVPTTVRPVERCARKMEEEALIEAETHPHLHGTESLQEFTPASNLLQAEGHSNAAKGPGEAFEPLQD